jgi:hypothetical protein
VVSGRLQARSSLLCMFRCQTSHGLLLQQVKPSRLLRIN